MSSSSPGGWRPGCHIYGRKEVGYILRVAAPKVLITVERFGRMEYQPDLLADVPAVGHHQGLEGRDPSITGSHSPIPSSSGSTPTAPR
jgi:acyl-CoA synthetase